MSKIDNLKLKNIEALTKIQLMASGSGSGSGSWSGGTGTSESDCMSQSTYDALVKSGASVGNAYVCGWGYVSNPANVYGSGSGSGSGGSGSYDWGSSWWTGSGSYGSGGTSSGSGGCRVIESNVDVPLGELWATGEVVTAVSAAVGTIGVAALFFITLCFTSDTPDYYSRCQGKYNDCINRGGSDSKPSNGQTRCNACYDQCIGSRGATWNCQS